MRGIIDGGVDTQPPAGKKMGVSERVSTQLIALAVVQHGVARHYPAGMLLEHYFDGHGRARDQLLLGSNELDPDVDPLCRRVDRAAGRPGE
jgi:hypothetical protein